MRELRIFIDELSGLSFFFLIDFFLINIIENDTFIFLVFDAFFSECHMRSKRFPDNNLIYKHELQ